MMAAFHSSRRVSRQPRRNSPNSSSPAPSRAATQALARAYRLDAGARLSGARVRVSRAADRVPRRRAGLWRSTRARRPELRDRGAAKSSVSSARAAAARRRRCASPPGSSRRPPARRVSTAPRSKARAATSPWCSRITPRRCCRGAPRPATSRWRWRRWACRARERPARIAALLAARRPARASSTNIPSQMSGGMQQRLQIARCLAQEPGRAADGRAVRRARRDDAAGAAGRDARDRARKRRDDLLRHPRSGRGDLSRRPRDRPAPHPGRIGVELQGRPAAPARSAGDAREPGVPGAAPRALRFHPRRRERAA